LAKALELRAAMSLVRLWQQQGKRDEAHALQAPIHGWFTEGLDTADLQEARTLLDAVSGWPDQPHRRYDVAAVVVLHKRKLK
jgi:predicted ATPase